MAGFIVVIISLAILIAIFYAINEWRKDMALLCTVTDRHRGTRSERKLILNLLKHEFPAVTVYHDIYVERDRGQYSQIDAVVVTKVGIIVFEVKDYSGWLFGMGHQKYWTQVLAFGKEKHRFYNPVLQNKSHIETLKKKLDGIADVPFYSVVIFYGSCTLRDISFIPQDTYVGYAESVIDIVSDILENNLPADYNDKRGVINTLKEAAANGGNIEIVSRHIQNIRNYVG